MITEDFKVVSGGLAEPSDDILGLIEHVSIHAGPFIDGRFVEAETDESFDNLSPINGSVINEIPSCGEADVERAVRSARAAFDGGSWSARPPGQRKQVLLKFAELIEANADELAAIEAIDVGKAYEAARSVDIPSAIRTVYWYGEAVDKIYGEIAPTATMDLIVREPLGVIGAVVPWNYPLMIAAWKLGPILAAGNSVVLKPAEQSPLSALRVAELAVEAGLPDGVFNVVPGLGERAGRALGLHPDVDGIAFTGSTEVGRMFLGYSSKSTIKSISLECGGKSPYLIFEDADLEEAIAKMASGVFYNAGQSCNAPTRLLVSRNLSKDVGAALTREAESYYPNHPLRRGTKVGAVVSQAQVDRIAHFVSAGLEEGATLVCGGSQCFENSGGFYFEPTVFENSRSEMKISQEEIFGPVVPIETFDSLDEAIHMANATRYGLWANVWTNDLKIAYYCARNIRAGTVGINNVFGGDITTPLGGYKQSGTGRDRSLHAIDKYSQLKHVSINV
ncbi:MAG TPA: aldehyde dehydrogenase family protein [Actinomycetota bacterium]|nr:aldehyde dehydrogenase family protein [Actinomycetota bacterium]